METIILISLAFCSFLAVTCVSLMQNHFLLKSADKRLNKANEMVVTLAHSADNLAESVSHLKDMMVHLENVYTQRTDMVIKNRDEFKDAYQALLKNYKEKEEQIRDMQERQTQQNIKYAEEVFRTIQEMARKTTITNNPVLHGQENL